MAITSIVSTAQYLVTLDDGRVFTIRPEYDPDTKQWTYPGVPADVIAEFSGITASSDFTSIVNGVEPRDFQESGDYQPAGNYQAAGDYQELDDDDKTPITDVNWPYIEEHVPPARGSTAVAIAANGVDMDVTEVKLPGACQRLQCEAGGNPSWGGGDIEITGVTNLGVSVVETVTPSQPAVPTVNAFSSVSRIRNLGSMDAQDFVQISAVNDTFGLKFANPTLVGGSFQDGTALVMTVDDAARGIIDLGTALTNNQAMIIRYTI